MTRLWPKEKVVGDATQGRPGAGRNDPLAAAESRQG